MKSLRAIPPFIYVVGVIALIGAIPFGNRLLQGISHALNQEKPSMAGSRSLRAIAFSPANASASLLEGNELFKQGEYKQAAQQFQRAIREMPENPIPRIYAQNAQLMDQDHLKIAAVVPLGSNRNVSLEMLRGMAIAQEYFNRNGSKVILEIFNDNNDPHAAKSVAQEIVKDPQIKAVVGHNASNSAIHAAPIYDKAGVVMITPTSFDTALSGIGQYIYRTIPNIRHLAGNLVDYSINTTRRKKVAVCYDSEAADNLAFKEEFVNALISANGQHIPTDCNFSAPDFDAKSMVSQLISDGADAVLLTPHIDRLDRLIDLSKANRWRMVMLGSPSLETAKILEIAQGDLNGLVIPVPYHQDMRSAQGFVEENQAKFQTPPTWRTISSMDALSAVLWQSQSADSRGDIQARLRQSGFESAGAAEPIRFLPTGDRVGKGVLVQIRPKAKGYHFEMIGLE